MTTIRSHVEAMGVNPAELQDTDEYFEVIQSLVVGEPGSVVYEQAKLINPANKLQPADVVQVRRRIGLLSDAVPEPVSYDTVVAADSPVLYLPDSVTFPGDQTKVAHPGLGLTGPFSLEAWVRYDGKGSVSFSTDYGTVFGASATRRLLINFNGTVLAQMGGGNVQSVVGVFPVGARTALVYTYDGAGVDAMERIYVDGLQVAAKATPSGPTWSAAFWEGAYTDPTVAYAFRGVLDHRAVYAQALTPERVRAHRDAGV